MKGKANLLTMAIHKDTLIVQWKTMQGISNELDHDLAIMYEMSNTWNVAGRLEFLNKNKISKYKETKE